MTPLKGGKTPGNYEAKYMVDLQILSIFGVNIISSVSGASQPHNTPQPSSTDQTPPATQTPPTSQTQPTSQTPPATQTPPAQETAPLELQLIARLLVGKLFSGKLGKAKGNLNSNIEETVSNNPGPIFVITQPIATKKLLLNTANAVVTRLNNTGQEIIKALSNPTGTPSPTPFAKEPAGTPAGGRTRFGGCDRGYYRHRSGINCHKRHFEHKC